ncbi:MAG: RNA polymerase sigma factor [Stellaceae bacterium]
MHGIFAAEEAVLVARLRRGEPDAARALMQRHNRALWRIARGILRNDADAEDVVQDAYLRAFTCIGDFRGEASLGSWLGRIVVNEALRRLGRRRPTGDLAEVDGVRSPVPSPEEAAARVELRRMVERAIDALPRPFRIVFMLRNVEQASVAETASALGIPEATVKTRLHRANRMLRVSLGAELAASIEDAFPFGGARCARLTARVLARLPPVAPSSASGNLSAPARVQ